jgi:hypothetical protein
LVRENTLTKVSPPVFRRVFVPSNAGEAQMHIRRGGVKAQGGIHIAVPVPPLISLALVGISRWQGSERETTYGRILKNQRQD